MLTSTPNAMLSFWHRTLKLQVMSQRLFERRQQRVTNFQFNFRVFFEVPAVGQKIVNLVFSAEATSRGK
jgi:hypothetical protein